MHPARHIPRYTYSDYLLWQGDWEMIDGVPHAMSPSANRNHQWISTILTSEILTGIRNKTERCDNCIIVQDVDWIIDDSTVLRPDIALICDQHDDFITAPPVLIIEILSPSTAHRDRIIKRELYEEQRVKYYIIVDPVSKSYTSLSIVNGKYEEYTADTFDIHDGCTITIDIAKVLA